MSLDTVEEMEQWYVSMQYACLSAKMFHEYTAIVESASAGVQVGTRGGMTLHFLELGGGHSQ